MAERDLKLQTYEISSNRYRELKYFCRQYREKISQLRSITEISSPRFDREGSSGGGLSDTTVDTAMRRMALGKHIELIEKSAIEADADIYEYILDNVVDGIAYEYLGVPSGRRQFYESRRKFFWILDKKKMG